MSTQTATVTTERVTLSITSPETMKAQSKLRDWLVSFRDEQPSTAFYPSEFGRYSDGAITSADNRQLDGSLHTRLYSTTQLQQQQHQLLLFFLYSPPTDPDNINIIIAGSCAGSFILILMLGLLMLFCHKKQHDEDRQKSRLRKRKNGLPDQQSTNGTFTPDVHKWTWARSCVYTAPQHTTIPMSRGSLSGSRSPNPDTSTVLTVSRYGPPRTATTASEPF
ncbi:hypothetical protein LSH36_123g02004 [Paralvinella palmiformis]|uniref:Uncharacterized protein n=1 Tax=Paralvinella palmiformis TaxID=53620 RepID=A0AAD9NAF8_9ANNE|nr:hypothetical protein LSH36_123g02004 [Paralvinella palmiformis]